MTPERAMKELVSAALANNVGAVARLFDSESLEMTSVALVRAIAAGNTDVALDLAGRGVAFEPYLQPAPQLEHAESGVEERTRFYLADLLGMDSRSIPYGEGHRPRRPAVGKEFSGCLYLHAASRLCAKTVRSLADEGLLSARDRAGLLLAAANYWVAWGDMGYRDIALLLAGTFDGLPPYPTINFGSCGLGSIVASSLLDLAARCQLKYVSEYMERAVDLSQSGGIPFSYLEVAAVMLDEKTSAKRAALIGQGMKKGGIDLSVYPQLF